MRSQQEIDMDNQEYMDWLFHTFHPLMWHTAKKYCRKETLWEEIIQESLVRLLACVPRLRSLPEEKLAGYILVTTRNTTYILAKEERMIRMENVEALAKVWDDLPEDMRYLLSGYYLLGYKTSQLARELGCGESTVRMRLTRARRYAKELMQQKEGVSP